jgi:hypothetical protein
MSASLKYAATGVGAIALIVIGLWPFLDDAGRNGVMVAAGVALPVQVLAFTALNRFRGETNGFLAAWVGGTLLRMVVLAVVAITVIRSGTEGAVPMLLALAGFFFGLLLLEPVYFRIETNKTVEA